MPEMIALAHFLTQQESILLLSWESSCEARTWNDVISRKRIKHFSMDGVNFMENFERKRVRPCNTYSNH